MLNSGDLMFSFRAEDGGADPGSRTRELTGQEKADVARGFQDAIVEVLVKKSLTALRRRDSGNWWSLAVSVPTPNAPATRPSGRSARADGPYPELEFCTGQRRDDRAGWCNASGDRFPAKPAGDFAVRPRWPLSEIG